MASKKLFSLLHTQDVELRAGQKILSEEAFSHLMESRQLLETAQNDARQYRKEIVDETESARELALKEGFEAGLQSWSGQVFQLEQEVEKIRKNYEHLIAKVAVKAAQAVVGKQLAVTPETFVDIVAHTLKAVSQHRRIVIYCSRHDHDMLEEQKPRLKALFEQLDVLSIQAKGDLPEGGYTIETERGIINNADVDKVWLALEIVFDAQLRSGDPSK